MTASPSFWDFSLEIYGRDGVAEACLVPAGRRSAPDVNLLLLCCFVARYGVRPDARGARQPCVSPGWSAWQDGSRVGRCAPCADA